MDDELLVRSYNVGLGDCLYVRVPDDDGGTREGAKHILIDCGNKFSAPELLRAAIDDLKNELPTVGGKKRLDLLIATHPHEDHVRGFDAERFDDVAIGAIGLSVSMDRSHPQAKGFHAFQTAAIHALREQEALGLSEAQRLLTAELLGLTKAEAMTALRKGLPNANGMSGPRYVHDEMTTPLLAFADAATRLHVLAPAKDIDRVYLGDEDAASLDQYLADTERRPANDLPEAETATDVQRVAASASPRPTNIGAGDFARLRTRLHNNALAFALTHSHLMNNTSVVLLLEWRGRRLLFTGDAEVQLTRKGRYEEGKRNGSWNAMWARHRNVLDAPLDFLKVGHHGSHNATPWTAKTVRQGGQHVAHPVNEILDALLPVDASPEARCIVSTERRGYKTIPDPALIAELGRRVANKARYNESQALGVFVESDVDQPQRTDLEGQPFIDFRFRGRT